MSTSTSRRRFLIASTATLGVVGVGIAASTLAVSLSPSQKQKAANLVEVDIRKIAEGQLLRVRWRYGPVLILHRSNEVLERLANTKLPLIDGFSEKQPEPSYIPAVQRSIHPNFLVVMGICTHLGMELQYRPPEENYGLGDNWEGGWVCPRHDARFDLSGRLIKYASFGSGTNLYIPPHYYRDEHTLVIGEHSELGVTHFTARTGTTQG